MSKHRVTVARPIIPTTTVALGFRRSLEPPHLLEIDPATIETAVGLFESYTLGTVSARELAQETGLEASRTGAC